MISRRRARETPRIYSSCIRTHTRVLHINRCIYIYVCDVARDTTTTCSPVPIFTFLVSSLLFSFSFSIDESIVDTDNQPEFHPLLSFPCVTLSLSFSSVPIFVPHRFFLSHRYTCAYSSHISLSLSLLLSTLPFSLSHSFSSLFVDPVTSIT